MALRHENSGKENASTRDGSVNRENDLGKLCTLNGVREPHGVDRLVGSQAIQTRTVAHARILVGKNEIGRDTVWRWQNGKGRCR